MPRQAPSPSAARGRLCCVPCLLLLTLLSPTGGIADERRQSSGDTARDSVPTRQSVSSKQPTAGRLSVGAPPSTLQEKIDPAVRQYWTDKCVQQRARGWGQTGDCNHPAYSGAGYGAAPVVVVPYSYPAQQRNWRRDQRRGQINMPPPSSDYRGHLR